MLNIKMAWGPFRGSGHGIGHEDGHEGAHEGYVCG